MTNRSNDSAPAKRMNDAIWLDLMKTDPAHTKKVSQGGRQFTTVDAYHQFQRMTEKFGPVGEGWGWTVQEQSTLGSAVWVRILFWWTLPDSSDPLSQNSYQTYGGARWQTKEGKDFDPDEAYKKALTDALTKAMSYLGMNADIFQGMFDDNKYVQQRAQEAKKESAQKTKEQKEQAKTEAEKNQVFRSLEEAINRAENDKALKACGADVKTEQEAGNINDSEAQVLRDIYKAKAVFLAKEAAKGAGSNGKE